MLGCCRRMHSKPIASHVVFDMSSQTQPRRPYYAMQLMLAFAARSICLSFNTLDLLATSRRRGPGLALAAIPPAASCCTGQSAGHCRGPTSSRCSTTPNPPYPSLPVAPYDPLHVWCRPLAPATTCHRLRATVLPCCRQADETRG